MRWRERKKRDGPKRLGPPWIEKANMNAYRELKVIDLNCVRLSYTCCEFHSCKISKFEIKLGAQDLKKVELFLPYTSRYKLSQTLTFCWLFVCATHFKQLLEQFLDDELQLGEWPEHVFVMIILSFWFVKFLWQSSKFAILLYNFPEI